MSSFKNKQGYLKRMIQRLSDFSGFDTDFLQNLVTYASCLPAKGSDIIDETVFTAQMGRMFKLTDSLMVSRMYTVCKTSEDRHSKLTIEDYCKMLCIFMSSDLDIKVNFVFKIYDLDGDGKIDSKRDMVGLLRPSLLSIIEEMSDLHDNMRDIIDMVLNCGELKRNKALDLNEFRTLVHRNILALQLLGPCLPSQQNVELLRKSLTGIFMDDVAELFKDERTFSLRACALLKKSLYPVRLAFI